MKTPQYTISPPLGEVTACGRRFTFHAEEWFSASDSLRFFELEPSSGEHHAVRVFRQGRTGDGTWGVDARLVKKDGAMSPAEAREWAHALLAAASLADALDDRGRKARTGRGEPALMPVDSLAIA